MIKSGVFISLIFSFFFSKYFIVDKEIDLNSINSSVEERKKNFKIYDAIMIDDKPDLTKFGLSKINMIYEDSLLSSNKIYPNNLNERIIDYKKLKRQINKVDVNYPTCLDVENWLLDKENVNTSVLKYEILINIFKTNFEKVDIGYYGVLPHADINIYQSTIPFIKSKSPRWMEEWNYINSSLERIYKSSTIAYPSCYTRYKDRNLWITTFKKQISKVREINPNLKIYVYLWPQYYSHGFGYNNTEVEGGFWKTQLKMAYEYADGAVIWYPPFDLKTREKKLWDENSSWWKVTKEFIKDKKIETNIYEN